VCITEFIESFVCGGSYEWQFVGSNTNLRTTAAIAAAGSSRWMQCDGVDERGRIQRSTKTHGNGECKAGVSDGGIDVECGGEVVEVPCPVEGVGCGGGYDGAWVEGAVGASLVDQDWLGFLWFVCVCVCWFRG